MAIFAEYSCDVIDRSPSTPDFSKARRSRNMALVLFMGGLRDSRAMLSSMCLFLALRNSDAQDPGSIRVTIPFVTEVLAKKNVNDEISSCAWME